MTPADPNHNGAPNGAPDRAKRDALVKRLLLLATDPTKSGELASVAVEIASIADADNDSAEQPTVDDPLRGLTRLACVALVGRERILEMAAQPIAYVWADIAVRGTIVVLAGGPGAGKTTLLFLLLVARANGGKAVSLLTRTVHPAPPGRYVVIIEAEHGEISTARKLLAASAERAARVLDRIQPPRSGIDGPN